MADERPAKSRGGARAGAGRRPVNEPRATVSTWLPASYHDRLIRMANQQDVKVSALVRQLLVFRLR